MIQYLTWVKEAEFGSSLLLQRNLFLNVCRSHERKLWIDSKSYSPYMFSKWSFHFPLCLILQTIKKTNRKYFLQNILQTDSFPFQWSWHYLIFKIKKKKKSKQLHFLVQSDFMCWEYILWFSNTWMFLILNVSVTRQKLGEKTFCSRP